MMMVESLGIDRRFRGIGRIKKRTGTTSPALRRSVSLMLTVLHKGPTPRWDVLRAIRDDEVDLLTVYDHYRRNALDRLPIGQTAALLAEAMTKWMQSLRVPDQVSEKHLASLETSRRYLVGDVQPRGMRRPAADRRVNDLPVVLEELRGTLGVAHPRSFNLARAAALAFVRDRLKRNHPLWAACAAVEVQPVRPAKGRPLTPVQLANFFPAPASDHLDALAWSMVTSGMHAKEYWGTWHTQPDRIHVEGEKRGGRVRDVPRVVAPVVPTIVRTTFDVQLRKRSDRQFKPYDLRRTYANLLEAALIPRTRRRLYLGHGVRDVTDLYEHHEVTAFLVEDAARLRAYLAKVIPPTATVVRRYLQLDGDGTAPSLSMVQGGVR